MAIIVGDNSDTIIDGKNRYTLVMSGAGADTDPPLDLGAADDDGSLETVAGDLRKVAADPDAGPPDDHNPRRSIRTDTLTDLPTASRHDAEVSSMVMT